MMKTLSLVSLVFAVVISTLLAGCSGGAGAAATSTPNNNPGSGNTTSPGITLSAASLTFPTNQTVGTTSPAISVAVTDSGAANLVISSSTITGTNASDFTVTPAGTLTITPNSSATLNVTFAPKGAGSRTATLNIADSASGSPHTVALSGTGVSPPTANITSINHIIFMIQENRSFDQYFGMLNAYRLAQGLSADVDGFPGAETGTVVPDCTNWIACNPAYQTRTPIPVYHYTTACTNDYSPSWNESHVDFNLENSLSMTAKNDGFGRTQRNHLHLPLAVNSQGHSLSALAAQPEMLHYDRLLCRTGRAGFEYS